MIFKRVKIGRFGLFAKENELVKHNQYILYIMYYIMYKMSQLDVLGYVIHKSFLNKTPI